FPHPPDMPRSPGPKRSTPCVPGSDRRPASGPLPPAVGHNPPSPPAWRISRLLTCRHRPAFAGDTDPHRSSQQVMDLHILEARRSHPPGELLLSWESRDRGEDVAVGVGVPEEQQSKKEIGRA